jgi:hypothetical protein
MDKVQKPSSLHCRQNPLDCAGLCLFTYNVVLIGYGSCICVCVCVFMLLIVYMHECTCVEIFYVKEMYRILSKLQFLTPKILNPQCTSWFKDLNILFFVFISFHKITYA